MNRVSINEKDVDSILDLGFTSIRGFVVEG